MLRPRIELLEDRTVPSGEPILVVTTPANPFSSYYPEILRAEGLNSFATSDISAVSASSLAGRSVVILGEMPLTSSQVTMFSDWVTAGGNLIAMRPDKQLANLLGLTDASSTRANAYLLVNTTSGPGIGIVSETMQYHGTADLYTLNGASGLATLYANATTSTSNPAVTLRSVGSNGGQAAAFTYDLARSVVYTRQGNPAWSGQNRDGLNLIRSNDLFYGNASFDPQPDWVDLNKIAIPQADEQQRLLANLVTEMDLDNMPLPRFWYLPRGEKAAVVMTGDDHGTGGTAGRFDQYLAASPPDSSPDDWSAIRSTSYIYANTPLTNAQAAAYAAQGFEVALHVSTNQADWTSQQQLDSFYANQLAQFRAKYSSLSGPVSNRTHAVVWSDYTSQPKVESKYGIRFDTNYYHYGPAGWIDNRPGLMTGSGLPMRFADTDGTLIDVYQAATQLTDESGQVYPAAVNSLLDAAIDSRGYYGVITANMHTDSASSAGSDAIIAAALNRSVPVVSAKQMLTWLDGRNGSTYSALSWNAAQNALSFTITPAAGATGLEGMVPVRSATGVLTGLTRGGTTVAYSVEVIKGVAYALFPGDAGNYAAQYGPDTTAPTVTARSPASGTTGVATIAAATATFSESVRPDTISFVLRDSVNNVVAGSTSYNASTNTVTFTPSAPLNLATTYTATVSGAKDHAGNVVAQQSWSFTTTSTVIDATIWPSTALPGTTSANDSASYELGLKFRSDVGGYVTGVRFFKGTGNTGTHVGHLWAADGTLLGTATFANETASGWQTVTFSSQVAISANTTYVASYFAPNGHYAFDGAYFSSAGVDAGVLHALSDSASAGNGVFRSGTSAFPNSSFNATNYWVDVVFSSTLAPSVTARTPDPNATGVNVNSAITATFNRPLNPATVNASTLRLRAAGASTDVPATVSYSGQTATLRPNAPLAVNTSYQVTITTGVTGEDGTPVAADITWSFTTQQFLSVTDTTLADFSAGTLDAVAVTGAGNGEVTLKPAAGSEFAGTALPADWTSTAWGAGGAATVAGGLLTVDGARAGTSALYAPGRSLEFVATFTTDGFQHAGFAVDFSTNLFAMFSTKSGGALYARTAGPNGSAETQLAAGLLGSPHRYRIDWTSTDVKYSIDGVQVAAHALAVTDSMRPIASDFTVGAAALAVDWMWLSPPYTASGTFLSRVLDAGTPASWVDATWAASVPAETSLAMSVRMGNTPAPDATWTEFVTLATSGTALTQTSRYLQYRAVLATTNTEKTAALQAVTFQYRPGAAPVASADSYSTDEDVTLTVSAASGVLANDTDLNGDALTAILVSGPAHGTLTLNANGSFTYTPAANYNGSDSFTYKANDRALDSNSVQVSLTVTAVNDAPVAANDSGSIAEDSTLTVNAPGVLANDNDVDSSTLTAVLVSGPAHGTLTLNSNGSFSYTPSANYNGSDSFTYKANDGSLDSTTATVSLTVTPVNDAPVAANDSYTTAEDTPLTINAPGVRDNDTDVDGDALSAVLVGGPAHGSLTFNSNGSFTYTPAANYNGSDSFTYRVNDGALNSNTATVSLTVTPVNDAPVAGNNNYSTAEESSLGVSAASGVLANDTDVDGDALTAVLVSGPAHGTLTLNANGSFTYTPVAQYNGSDSFSYQARDPSGALSGVATVALTVTPPTLRITDVSANEGGLLQETSFTFTVSLSSATSRTITVSYATADGTATAGLGLLGGDYDAASGTLTFQGQTSRTVTVMVHGDLTVESNETFFVNLSSATTPIADNQGKGTILNDDSGLLLFEGDEVAASEPAVTQEELVPIVDEAKARWAAEGVDTGPLSGIEFRIADLPDTTLGATTTNAIWIDANAAGHGWFIDLTPTDDKEFATTPTDPAPFGRVDLLTVVAHEMGHALGLEHSATGVMQETLAPGVRHPLDSSGPAAAVLSAPKYAVVTPASTANITSPVAALLDSGGWTATPARRLGLGPVETPVPAFLTADNFDGWAAPVINDPTDNGNARAQAVGAMLANLYLPQVDEPGARASQPIDFTNPGLTIDGFEPVLQEWDSYLSVNELPASGEITQAELAAT